jgi:hypothetical protein
MVRVGMTTRNIFYSLLAMACAAPVAKDPELAEEDAPIDGAFDSLRSPTDHGALTLAMTTAAEITRDERVHAWTFELFGQASVAVATEEDTDGTEVDTVLYLYREGPRGWGRYIARNDDANGLFSALSRSLDVGRYRVAVKGYDGLVRGPFLLSSDCSGVGCPSATASCLFGTSFSELGTGRVEVLGRDELRAASPLDPVQEQQVVLAVQQSSHTDVSTPAEAFERVDQNVIQRLWLLDAEGQRAFVAYEYGAGDSSYGAIFVRASTTIVARIHDGDLEDCSVSAATCALGATWIELERDPRFETRSRIVITAASSGALDPRTRAQALAAMRISYAGIEELETVEEGLMLVDRGELQRVELRERASGRDLTAYEHGAGDTSVGAVFFGATTEVAGIIDDLAIAQCAFFEDR